MNKYKLVNVVLALIVLVMAFFHLERSRQAAMREADALATTRLLQEFHQKYVLKKGLDYDEYRKAVTVFADEHKGLIDLERYAQ